MLGVRLVVRRRYAPPRSGVPARVAGPRARSSSLSRHWRAKALLGPRPARRSAGPPHSRRYALASCSGCVGRSHCSTPSYPRRANQTRLTPLARPFGLPSATPLASALASARFALGASASPSRPAGGPRARFARAQPVVVASLLLRVGAAASPLESRPALQKQKQQQPQRQHPSGAGVQLGGRVRP